MSESNQLQGLLSELARVYDSKQHTPRILTPAEMSTKLHPLLDRMCVAAENHGASDIFICVNFPPALKINGTIRSMEHDPLTAADTAAITQSTMSDSQITAFNRDLELNYAIQSRSNTRYRVNAYHEQGRCGMVLRRISHNVPSLDELSLPQKLKDLALVKRGLLIISGPTGSGKSTSMAAMIQHRNERMNGHIVTIEDPIEYLFQSKRSIITQREIGIDTVDWNLAIQNAMRQTPDVICIGEVRSDDSMEYALQLAQTGHLCIFTIHANNAVQAIERIINLYPEDRQPQVFMDLALNLTAVISQRLVMKKDQNQRVAIIDLMLNNSTIQDLIYKGDLLEIKDIMLRSARDSDEIQTFDQQLFELYINNQIEYDEALRQSDSANDLRLRIQLHEVGGDSERLYERIGNLDLVEDTVTKTVGEK